MACNAGQAARSPWDGPSTGGELVVGRAAIGGPVGPRRFGGRARWDRSRRPWGPQHGRPRRWSATRTGRSAAIRSSSGALWSVVTVMAG